MRGTVTAVVDTIRANAHTEYDIDTVARVTWASITDPGDVEVSRLIRERGATSALEAALDPDLDILDGISLVRLRRRLGPRTSVRVADALRLSADSGWTIATPIRAAWPTTANDLDDAAPLCLWVAGDPTLLNGPTLGVVGSEPPTDGRRHDALVLSGALADKGWVLTGTAEHGVSELAHWAALAVHGGTIAVLPCGVDQAYPDGQDALLADIESRGALVSEFAPGTIPTRNRCRRRDLLLAALCTKTIVIDAEVDSDATIIGEQSRILGRHVGTLATSSLEEERSGCRQLRRWFGARTVRSVVDVDRL